MNPKSTGKSVDGIGLLRNAVTYLMPFKCVDMSSWANIIDPICTDNMKKSWMPIYLMYTTSIQNTDCMSLLWVPHTIFFWSHCRQRTIEWSGYEIREKIWTKVSKIALIIPGVSWVWGLAVFCLVWVFGSLPDNQPAPDSEHHQDQARWSSDKHINKS